MYSFYKPAWESRYLVTNPTTHGFTPRNYFVDNITNRVSFLETDYLLNVTPYMYQN